MIVTVSLEDGHEPLVIVQTNLLAPVLRPVTAEVGDTGVVIVALPVITVHAPVPIEGAFPPSVVELEHTVWSAPALAVVGIAALMIVTVSLEAGQLALLIVQTNVFVPTDNPETPEVGVPGAITVAPPTTTVHNPDPTVGVFPARAADELQIF